MVHARLGLKALAALLLFAMSAASVLAQIAAPRTLPELKAEIQERANRRAYPVSQLDPAEVREALALIRTPARDRQHHLYHGE